MNELQVFEFDAAQNVRVVIRDGDPWFVAKDVCGILGLGNVSEALRGLDDDERFALRDSEGKMLGFKHTPDGVNVISEPGLYKLMLRSNKPEAKTFQRWVFHEVLPAIRKTGRYVSPRKCTPGEMYSKEVVAEAGRAFFFDCYWKGGLERYLEERYTNIHDTGDNLDTFDDPRDWARVRNKILNLQERSWHEEAKLTKLLVKKGRLEDCAQAAGAMPEEVCPSEYDEYDEGEWYLPPDDKRRATPEQEHQEDGLRA